MGEPSPSPKYDKRGWDRGKRERKTEENEICSYKLDYHSPADINLSPVKLPLKPMVT